MLTSLRLVAATSLLSLVLAAPVTAATTIGDMPETATGSYLAGQQALEELRTHQAAEFLGDAAAAEWNNAPVLSRAYVALAADGQVEHAARVAQHLLEVDPSNDLARLVIATNAIKARRYEAALRQLDKLGTTSFEGITGAMLRAWALTGQGKLAEAFKGLDSLGDNGLKEFIIFHKAIMADVGGNTAEATKDITEALKADPATADVVEAYARIYGNAGRFDEALAAIKKFEDRGQTHPVLTDLKAALQSKQRPGPFADTVQAGAAEMFHSVGMAFARQGTSDISLVLMRLGGFLDPRNDTIALVIGQLYDEAGQHETANAVYEAIPASSPLKPMATVRVASNLDTTGDRKEAIRRLSNIVTADPEDLDAVSMLGDLLRGDKQYLPAADAYTKALQITGGQDPADWRFYYVRGIAYERGDKFPMAEKDFQKALALNPTQPQVLNYLGYSWVDKGMHLQEALEMIKKAIAGSPNDGYIIDSLGWAYYRLGRYPDAVTQLEQAAILRPNDPEINDHLGDAYWRVGRKLEAHFQWSAASTLDTEGDVKARVAPKLKDGLDDVAPGGEVSTPQADTGAASSSSGQQS